jgi:hypothetical protein
MRVNGSEFSMTSKLCASDGYTDDNFGSAVSVYSTTALIGAYHKDQAYTNQGNLFISIHIL